MRAGHAVVDGKGRHLGKVTSAAFAGAEQLLLIWADKNALTKGARIGFVRPPTDSKSLPPEPAKEALEDASSAAPPLVAEIMTRFMTAAEKARRSYTK